MPESSNAIRKIAPAGDESDRQSSGRTSKAEHAARVEKVYELLILGFRRARILQFASENWGVSARTADGYIGKANRLLEKDANVRRERELGKALGRYNLIFAGAVLDKDRAAALAAQREIDALLGLRAPKEIRLSWEDQAVKDIQAGLVTFEAMAEAFDVDLATRLFTRAGVPVSPGEGTDEE